MNPLIEAIDQIRQLEFEAAEATDYPTADILKRARNKLTALNGKSSAEDNS